MVLIMQGEDFLDNIPFDAEDDTISTRVWSFTKERAVEKALNRIDYRAKNMGRIYSIIDDITSQSPNPADPTEEWQCFMKAQLL